MDAPQAFNEPLKPTTLHPNKFPGRKERPTSACAYLSSEDPSHKLEKRRLSLRTAFQSLRTKQAGKFQAGVTPGCISERRAFNNSLHLPSNVPCLNIVSESAPALHRSSEHSIMEQIDLRAVDSSFSIAKQTQSTRRARISRATRPLPAERG